ncbi:fibronectin type III domain-containing protein [Paenibacillus cymbidii]|uniref:fibronectin type III domain-containing protein n=1 Tax=Paenibacillus cymbidii TaxID=1639034 RepID=UPI00143687CD|nr:fibronectin type III domain-containing protein [Paenibacillus cymbidii]
MKLATFSRHAALMLFVSLLLNFLSLAALTPQRAHALEPSALIPLNTSMVVNESSYGNATWMVDEHDKVEDPRGNVCVSGDCKPLTQWNPSGHYTGASAYIDLGDTYKLTDVYLYDANNVGYLTVSVGTPGNWVPVGDAVYTNTYNSWQTVKNLAPVFTRYVRITMTSGAPLFNEIVLYGSPPDHTPPGKIEELNVSAATSTSAKLQWTAPGEDGNLRTAASYDIRYSTASITDANWAAATPVAGPPQPAAPGVTQTATVGKLMPNREYFFAIKTLDESGNVSALSEVAHATTNAAGKIVLSPGMVTNESAHGDATLMADEQSLSGDPRGGAGGAPLTQWTPGYAAGTYPAGAYIDLGKDYVLTDFWIYDSNGVDYLTLSTGSPGNWDVRQSVYMNTYRTWRSYVPPTPLQSRYVRTTMEYGGANFGEIVLYGVPATLDTIAPSAVSDLGVVTATTSSIAFAWTAPGDDDNTGIASSYDIRYSTSPITEYNWSSATSLNGVPAPAASGTKQSMTASGLANGTVYYFAMKTTDAAGNVSALSNVLKKGTPTYTCTKTIRESDHQQFFYGTAGTTKSDKMYLDLSPGSVLCIEGNRTYLKLLDINGTAEHPIIITNINGESLIANDNLGYALTVSNSTYFRLTGTGDPEYTYGIRVSSKKSGANAVSIGSLSQQYEIDHLEAFDSGFAGLMLKSDPTCDLSANRGHFVQRNTVVHDTYIHNVEGEGMYIGYTFFNGHEIACKNSVGETVYETVYPHTLEGLRVYDNRTQTTGRDGIQVSSAVSDVEVYNNVIDDYATEDEPGQTSGIQINPGTTGRFYNNLITNGIGKGFEVQGWGNIFIYNNVIVNPSSYGIFSKDARDNAGDPVYADTRGHHFVNNTIIGPTETGIRFDNTALTGNTFDNNIVITPGDEIIGSGTNLTHVNNLTYADIGVLHFVNAAGGDFHLSAASTLAIDQGADVSGLGVDDDFDGGTRPYGSGYDIGAYEYRP